MTRHASPFHCPYCGEQDLFPVEPDAAGPVGAAGEAAGWECRACLRIFAVRLLGQARRPAVTR